MSHWEFKIVHHLNSALGWVELGNFSEARAELNQLPPEFLSRPEVLEIRWIIDAAASDWESALQTAREILKVAPDHPEGWLHQAYALRRKKDGGLQSAREALEPVEDKFPEEPTIPYNLACYACQLGHLDQARALLQKAIQRGELKEIKKLALKDPDLKDLWKEIVDYK
jgi:tetratricopeptide (TPR) repeat protein